LVLNFLLGYWGFKSRRTRVSREVYIQIGQLFKEFLLNWIFLELKAFWVGGDKKSLGDEGPIH